MDDLNDWVGCLGGHPQALTGGFAGPTRVSGFKPRAFPIDAPCWPSLWPTKREDVSRCQKRSVWRHDRRSVRVPADRCRAYVLAKCWLKCSRYGRFQSAPAVSPTVGQLPQNGERNRVQVVYSVMS